MFKLALRNIYKTRTNYFNLKSINHNKLYVHIGVFNMAKNVKIDKEELRKRLTPLQYHVTQEKGTERPFSGCYNKTYNEGTYLCVVCEQPLFSSDTKYDSSCGWPAFNDVLDQGKVKLSPDTSGDIFNKKPSRTLRLNHRVLDVYGLNSHNDSKLHVRYGNVIKYLKEEVDNLNIF